MQIISGEIKNREKQLQNEIEEFYDAVKNNFDNALLELLDVFGHIMSHSIFLESNFYENVKSHYKNLRDVALIYTDNNNQSLLKWEIEKWLSLKASKYSYQSWRSFDNVLSCVKLIQEYEDFDIFYSFYSPV